MSWPVIRPLQPLPKHGNDPVSPYITTALGRPFRLLVDRPTIKDTEALDILDYLSASPEVERWSTTNDGDRWIEIEWETERNDHISAKLHSPGHHVLTTLFPASTWRTFAERMANSDLSAEEALRQLGHTNIGAEHRIDMVVSDSPHLLSAPYGIGGRTNIRSSKEAVAQLSLFLRSRQYFLLGDNQAFVRNRLWFYIVASRAAVPAGDRWFSGCQVSTGSADDVMAPDADPATLRALGQTCLERVGWAIRARDLVLSVVAVDLIPFYLDMFLLQMSGAFDAAAQVASDGLGVHLQRESPSWRKKRWLQELAKSHPSLAGAMQPGSPDRDALEVISLLRNSIHESGLPTIGMSTHIHGPTRTTVRTPRGLYAARTFADAIARLGGQELWGVETVSPGMTTIDPLRFVDHALVGGLRALNTIMRETPVERFPGVNPMTLRDGSGSEKGPADPWSEWTRNRILLLLGLRDEIDGF
jgi:hypothetical protein